MISEMREMETDSCSCTPVSTLPFSNKVKPHDFQWSVWPSTLKFVAKVRLMGCRKLPGCVLKGKAQAVFLPILHSGAKNMHTVGNDPGPPWWGTHTKGGQGTREKEFRSQMSLWSRATILSWATYPWAVTRERNAFPSYFCYLVSWSSWSRSHPNW